MANKEHSASAQIHKGRYIQSTDPGAVGAGVEWLDTNTTPAVAKKRDAANTGWDVIETGTTNLANLAVTTGKIADDAVTYAKLQNISATARLLGRVTAGAGNAEEIPLGAGLAFSGGALVSTVAAPAVAKTTSDQAINGSALVNVTGMSFAVAANTDYLFDFYVLFRSAALGTGIGLAVTCPAAPNGIHYSAFIPNLDDGSNAYYQGYGSISGDQITGPNAPFTGVTLIAFIHGILRNGVNSGSIQLQAANEIASNDITIKQGTMVRYQSVA